MTEHDGNEDDELADAYNEALALEKSNQFDQAAKVYKRVLELDPDDHGGAAVRMASMGKAPSPARAPQAYVSTLFDQHADVFDKVLVDDLGYDVPNMAAQMLADNTANQFERMLDLGCGTGLMAAAFKGQTQHLIGIDLSENMLEQAYDRELYDALYVADVEDYLSDHDEEPWDLICAMDVLPYLGDLELFIKRAAENLVTKGALIFSTETLPDHTFDEKGYVVGRYQRFAHKITYVTDLLETHRMSVTKIEDIIVRHEQGLPIYGHLILAQKQA